MQVVKKVVIQSTFCVLTLIAMICGASALEQTNAQPLPADGTIEITIGAVPLRVNIGANDVGYETAWLTTEFPMDCTVKDYKDLNIYLNGQLVTAAKPIQLKLDVINTETGIEVKVVNTATMATSVNYIRTVPKALNLGVSGVPEENGFYYFAINGYLCKMDQNGNFTFFAYKPGAVNFKPHIIEEQLYYTYSQQDNLAEGFDAGNMKASAHVMNQWYGEIDCIPYLLTDQGMPERHPLENHELVMLDEGHYIVSSYVVKRVYNIPKDVKGYSPYGSRVVAGIFQEIRDGKLIFQWDSTEHPELYGMSVDSNDFLNRETIYADYVHLNSVEIDPADGNYIVSLRNTATILKISKSTGDILWILGGKGDQFGLTATQKTSAQHHATISSRGTLTVFDNGLVLPNGTPNPFVDTYNTRIVEYRLEETNKKLISFKEYVVPGTSSPIMGSTKLIDENTNTFLIGWGGKRAGTPIFTETNFVKQQHTFEVWNRDGGITTGGTYRVYKSDR